MLEKPRIGVIHGRFQGLHNGHMEYLLEGKKRCECLVIGITNYLRTFKDERISSIDSHRLNSADNPFTYFERAEMIREALLEAGVPLPEFRIVPFPIEEPEKIFNFAPRDAVYYMTIYDQWGREKLDRLRSLGLNVDVMWTRDPSQKPISGSLVRDSIIHNRPWRHMVPPSVHRYITENGLDKRITEQTHD
ncbi:adenylyltransferase/cytidyltransferase family protein [Sutterella sp.]|uniref:adenylyltransferase/cytidyltransferase family protein n=1 Tax=Sutterella sp. TaxID=1981025 RepID=UPI0026DFB076|nr:adenylyltransferase/cytidyltransferase family protein [Sutterella sp.]MDO5531999.1 adenylyltransferase/cytidyltransferase family protein [Sutterella sp.]